MIYLTLFYVQWCEGVRSPRDWIYYHLWGAIWVLGIEDPSSGRATEISLLGIKLKTSGRTASALKV